MQTLSMQNSVDNESNSPQYLGVKSWSLPQLGNDFELGPPSRENRSRRKLNGNEEESRQEKETLTVRETIHRAIEEFRKASREKHLSRGFLLISNPRILWNNVFLEKMRGCPKRRAVLETRIGRGASFDASHF
jgi:hypothetical protein